MRQHCFRYHLHHHTVPHRCFAPNTSISCRLPPLPNNFTLQNPAGELNNTALDIPLRYLRARVPCPVHSKSQPITLSNTNPLTLQKKMSFIRHLTLPEFVNMHDHLLHGVQASSASWQHALPKDFALRNQYNVVADRRTRGLREQVEARRLSLRRAALTA
jgi:hypothetical protein